MFIFKKYIELQIIMYMYQFKNVIGDQWENI